MKDIVPIETTYKLAGKELLSTDGSTFDLAKVDLVRELEEFYKENSETFWCSYFQRQDAQECAYARNAPLKDAPASFLRYMQRLHSNYLTQLARQLQMLYWKEPRGYMLLKEGARPWKRN